MNLFKTLLLFTFLSMGSNAIAQSYGFNDKLCAVEIQVKTFKDSASLILEFENKTNQSIYTGGIFYATWTIGHKSIWVYFGDQFKEWRENGYDLAQVKPHSSLYTEIKVKNYFTDSTGIS